MAIRAVQAGPKTGGAGGGGGPAHYQSTFTLTTSSTVITSPVGSPAAKDQLSVILTQDATGGRQITWDVEFDPATTVNLATLALKNSRFHFIAEADNLWHLFAPPMLDE